MEWAESVIGSLHSQINCKNFPTALATPPCQIIPSVGGKILLPITSASRLYKHWSITYTCTAKTRGHRFVIRNHRKKLKWNLQKEKGSIHSEHLTDILMVTFQKGSTHCIETVFSLIIRRSLTLYKQQHTSTQSPPPQIFKHQQANQRKNNEIHPCDK